MSYTASQVERAIESHSDFGGWGDIKWSSKGEEVLDISLDGETVPVVKVDHYGGEGLGDELWVVVQIGTQYFKKDGYYMSHYGSDWDGDVTEVSPHEKVVTVYETL